MLTSKVKHRQQKVREQINEVSTFKKKKTSDAAVSQLLQNLHAVIVRHGA